MLFINIAATLIDSVTSLFYKQWELNQTPLANVGMKNKNNPDCLLTCADAAGLTLPQKWQHLLRLRLNDRLTEGQIGFARMRH